MQCMYVAHNAYHSVFLVLLVVLLVVIVDQHAFVQCKVPLVEHWAGGVPLHHVPVHQRRSVRIHPSQDFADLLSVAHFLRLSAIHLLIVRGR